jgi:hypothetical protein
MAGLRIKAQGKVPKVAVTPPRNPNLGFNNPARHVSRPPRIQAIATRDYSKVSPAVNPQDPNSAMSIPPGGNFGNTGT